MKQLLFSTLALLFALSVIGCGTQSDQLAPLSSVRPGRASEGSLANPALARDATLAIRKVAGGSKRVIKFVIQQPVGQPGKKAWREVWVYDPDGSKKPFVLTFREDGQGSANFEIQRM